LVPHCNSGFLDGCAVFRVRRYAEPNMFVYSALAFGALSIAFAIFLIFEFGQTYTGLFRVTPAALVPTIEFMDK
jgi:hypothetical protein